MLAQGPDEYWLGLEEYAVHTSGALQGQTTYRLYLNMLNPTDYLSACSGSEENPWVVESTSFEIVDENPYDFIPGWYNTPNVSELFADAINPAFFDAFPNLEYDSWLTIGASSAEDGMDISNVPDPNYDAFAAFENGEGINSDSPVGNLWFTLFPGLELLPDGTYNFDNKAFAGEDLKVLVAQITTSGILSGSLYVQIFPEGIQSPDIRLLLPIVYAPDQCTDPEACNYSAQAWLDTDCEYGPIAGTIVGETIVILQEGQTEWTYTCDAGADSYLWEVGNGATIVSGQGTNTVVIDWGTEVVAGTDVTVIASNGDCDGDMSSILVEFSVGISEIDLSSTLTAFPNPATTQVQINFESDFSNGRVDCQMRTITGQLVSTFVIIDGYATIDVSSLANGTYLLSLQTERGIVRQSLVVSH